MKFLPLPFLVLALFVLPTLATAEDGLAKEITVYKKPECTCCNKWIAYLKKHGYKVTAIDTWDVLKEKKRLGVPPELKACHTAVIDGYVVEGHLTHRDIQKLLLFKPPIKGIAIPDMPDGTPGMEKGDIVEPYDVYSFDEEGNTKIIRSHRNTK